jgi:hypothetical protein
MRKMIWGFVAFGLAGCSQFKGPAPEIESMHVVPPIRAGDSYKLDVEIRNRGTGEGEASLQARLRDSASGVVYIKESTVDLKSMDRVHVVLEFFAPNGSYTPQAECKYPPE